MREGDGPIHTGRVTYSSLLMVGGKQVRSPMFPSVSYLCILS